jgi:hypothetical protein
MRSAAIVILIYAMLGGAQLTQLVVESAVRTLDVIAMAVTDDGKSPFADMVADDSFGPLLTMPEEDVVHDEYRPPNPTELLWSEHERTFGCRPQEAADGWCRTLIRPPSV